jgi:hypothetical protein
MENVKKVALDKAIRLLDSLKLDYAIINTDGEYIIKGDIEIASKRTRSSTAPHGTYSALFKLHGVCEMNVGDVVVIPCGELDPAMVKRAASAYCYTQFGSRSSIASISENTVEIMRIDNGE